MAPKGRGRGRGRPPGRGRGRAIGGAGAGGMKGRAAADESPPVASSSVPQEPQGTEILPDIVGDRSAAGYFANKGVAFKSRTTLADLRLALGEDTKVHSVLDSLPVRQYNEIEALRVSHSSSFPMWRLLLREGYSIILYGFGSKRKLLEEFADTHLTDGGLLVVNGFNSAVTAKQILGDCATALLRSNVSQGKASTQPQEVLRSIRDISDSRMLYVVLHNIDGPSLRDTQAQILLSQLADCKCISLVASMDHVDTPLLWDKQTAARFNWVWQNASTYAPYVAEASHLPSMLLGRKDDFTAKGAVMVLRSLTVKARQVFQQLAENQDASETKEQGLLFSSWFKLCRERFLVTSELLLRTHLTEFKDHELVKVRRAADGNDLYYVPMEKSVLLKILSDMDADA